MNAVVTAVISVLRRLIAASLILGALLLVVGLLRGRLEGFIGRALLSLAVAALGSGLLWVDLCAPTGRRTRALGRLGAAATLIAVGLSLLLVGSPLITRGDLWRSWWVSSGLSLTSAHLLLLFRVSGAPPLYHIRNATIGAVLVFAALVIPLTFRGDVFALPGPVLSWAITVAGALEALGSAVLLAAARPAALRVPWTAVRVSRWTAFPVLLFAGGFYMGRLTAPPGPLLDLGSGALAGLSRPEVESEIRSDLVRLHAIAAGIERERARADNLRDALQVRLQAEARIVYTPEEDDAIRSLFFSYLSYRTALLRMVAYYQGFGGLRDRSLADRCFLLGLAAGAVTFDASLTLVSTYLGDPLVRAKLNEPEPIWGIPAGMFDRIQESVSLEKHLDLFREMSACFEAHRERWRACGLPAEQAAWLEDLIERKLASVRANPLFGSRAPLSLLLAKVKSDAYSPVYAVQSLASTWIGDTRLLSRPPRISAGQVEDLRRRLEPGDVILERRNWFLSNAFLPGFWPHAALYVGTLQDLKRLGIAGEAAVEERLQEFCLPAHDGEPRCVIESISEGVSFSSLSEATRADYIAVLRPRVDIAGRARAILRAFSHQGKPYDFEFDFFSSDKLVCTELVYRAYEGTLHFDLVKVMGRMTLPAVEIARKFARERSSALRQLDFVLFLDAVPGGDGAALREAEDFCASAERPRAFNE